MKRRVPRVKGPALDLARDELIGRAARVVLASDPGLVGLAGTIVDESLRTLTLRLGPAGSRQVRISKAGTRFGVATPAGEVELEGRAIEFRSEDRTKKVRS